MLAQCLISFGSNLGDRDCLITEAARILSTCQEVQGFCASRLFETPPIGGPQGQESFLNAVAAFETRASAREILLTLQRVETQLGRQRRQRWDARSIDLDVVLHGELVGAGGGLIVPHPRYTARQFVLEPACDVAPHYRDPRFGWTIEQLARHLRRGVPSLALQGGSESTRNSLCDLLRERHGVQTFTNAPSREPITIVGRAPRVTAEDGGQPSLTREITADSGAFDRHWVSAFVPPLPRPHSLDSAGNGVPRLIAQIQSTTAATRWPAPHQMWSSGWNWPEYRLEIDDLEWACEEVASALESMRCPVRPITPDGLWWR